MEIDKSILGALGTIALAVVSFVYGKGKKDSKLSEAIEALSKSILKLDGDIGGMGGRVRQLEDRSLVNEQKFVDRDFISTNYVSQELFKEKMNTLENKLDGIRESQQLLVDIMRGVKTDKGL